MVPLQRKLWPALQIFQIYPQNQNVLLRPVYAPFYPPTGELNFITPPSLFAQLAHLAILFILQLMCIAGSVRQLKSKIANFRNIGVRVMKLGIT